MFFFFSFPVPLTPFSPSASREASCHVDSTIVTWIMGYLSKRPKHVQLLVDSLMWWQEALVHPRERCCHRSSLPSTPLTSNTTPANEDENRSVLRSKWDRANRLARKPVGVVGHKLDDLEAVAGRRLRDKIPPPPLGAEAEGKHLLPEAHTARSRTEKSRGCSLSTAFRRFNSANNSVQTHFYTFYCWWCRCCCHTEQWHWSVSSLYCCCNNTNFLLSGSTKFHSLIQLFIHSVINEFYLKGCLVHYPLTSFQKQSIKHHHFYFIFFTAFLMSIEYLGIQIEPHWKEGFTRRNIWILRWLFLEKG